MKYNADIIQKISLDYQSKMKEIERIIVNTIHSIIKISESCKTNLVKMYSTVRGRAIDLKIALRPPR